MISRPGPRIAQSLGPVVRACRSLAGPASLAVASTLACTGCSFLFVHGPPDHPSPGQVVDCTTSRVAPGFDSAFTALEAFRVLFDVGASDSAFNAASISRGTDIGLGLALGALFLGSAWYGFAKTARCSEAVREDALPETGATSTGTASAQRPPATPPAPRQFQLESARRAVAAALDRIEGTCTGGVVHGQGEMTLSFLPDGQVGDLAFDPPFADDATESCAEGAVRASSVPAFDGVPITLRKRFDFGPRRMGARPDGTDTGAPPPEGRSARH